ncbi:MAG: hypothetical protein V8S27_04770 [Lachnospiraceae bacterium]
MRCKVRGKRWWKSRVFQPCSGIGDRIWMVRPSDDGRRSGLENANRPEAVKKIKWDNSNGPMAPAGAVIGFTGKGKGLQVLVDYARAKASGDVSGFEHPEELERMLKIAESASPISYIGPDTPPMALFSGINDVSIDIANRQSLRTFEKMGEYGVDGFSLQIQTVAMENDGRSLRECWNSFIRIWTGWEKETLFPRWLQSRERHVCLKMEQERENVSAPILRQGEEILVCADYAKEKFGAQIEPGEGDVWIDRRHTELGSLQEVRLQSVTLQAEIWR